MAIGESILASLLAATSREVSPSTESWLGVGDSCKEIVVGGDVTLLTMAISLPMLV